MPCRISCMWPHEMVIWLPPKGVVTFRLRTTCLHCFNGFALHITHISEIMKCLLFLYLHYFTYSLISAMLTQWHDLLIFWGYVTLHCTYVSPVPIPSSLDIPNVPTPPYDASVKCIHWKMLIWVKCYIYYTFYMLS